MRRLKYVRSADEMLPGFAGPKSEAEEITTPLGNFLRDTLKRELSQEKTLITHASTHPARFLGSDIIACMRNDQISVRGQRDLNGSIRRRVPAEVLEKKRAQDKHGRKPLRRMTLASQTDFPILNTSQADYRGRYQSSQLADHVCWLNKLHWDMQPSLLHTLAAKYHKSKQTMVHRSHAIIETPHGIRRCLHVTKEREGGKKPVAATFGGIPLRQNKPAILVDQLPPHIR